MIRRQLLHNIGQIAAGLIAGMAWPYAHAVPGYKVSAAQMQKAVAERFPRRYPLGGLLDINLDAPQLRLLPKLNRLGALMPLVAAGPALRRSYNGVFDTEFSLRYEASDLTLRAHQLQVKALRLDGLSAGQSALLDAYGPALAEQALQDAVLHQLTPQDLALPDNLGLQPGGITVTSEGLTISFVAKPMGAASTP